MCTNSALSSKASNIRRILKLGAFSMRGVHLCKKLQLWLMVAFFKRDIKR